jgi:PAS domain S-box-containing protein
MELIQKDFKDVWLKPRSNVLGFLIAILLLGTFIVDTGLPDGVAAWAPYSIAIVLALLWAGARTIASVTVMALVLMLAGLWIGPIGDLETGSMNRAIGAVTITGLGLICLYVDRARRHLLQSCVALTASQQQLHSFVDDMNHVGIVLCDLRGRVTEWNHGAQLLTGYAQEEIKGRPLYRVFPGTINPVAHWGQICRWARRRGEVAREEVFRRQDGSWCVIHMKVKPLKNRFRRHEGYSLVIHSAKSPSTLNGSSATSRALNPLLSTCRDLVLYRCRVEPRRTLDYIDTPVSRLLDDDAGVESSRGLTLGEWVHAQDREFVWNTIEAAVQARRSYIVVYRLVGDTGKERWVWDEGEAFLTDDGGVAGLEGFLARI